MPCDPWVGEFPYETYRNYVSALSATDSAYEDLRKFFGSSPDDLLGSHVHQETQVPRDGAVTIMDSRKGRKLDTRRYPVGTTAGSFPEDHIKDCIRSLSERREEIQTCIVFISYHRDPFTGEYTGVNTDILDAVGRRFAIHPEIFMWHFGSDFGLDKRFFPFASPPIPSALSSRNICHLRNHHSLFSSYLHGSGGSANGSTGMSNMTAISMFSSIDN